MPHKPLRCMFILGCMLALVGYLCPQALGQVAPAGRRLYDEQLRVELARQQAAAKQIGLDGGGWFSFALFDYEDDDAGRHRTLRQYELRLWGNYTVAGVHTFYVRGLVGFDDWNGGDNPNASRRDNDFKEPTVERAWYRFDYSRLVRNRTGRDPDVGLSVRIGRDYYDIGSGLVLALPLDAVNFTVNLRNWKLTGLFGATIHDTPNIDESAAVADSMDRIFYGGEIRYDGFSRHQPYVFVLIQDDHTGKDGGPAQSYQYDSQYFGVGSGGSILLANLRYATELVFQTGRGYAEGTTTGREKVQAMAFDILLEYLFEVAKHPKITFEYLFGSGDADRRLSSTSTIGGNQPGTKDEAFNAFGFRDTGLALAPRVSNLHIFQLGVSGFPLEQCKLFRKMEVGTKVYFYCKDRAGGAISDIQATRSSTWVGWEWDVFCNWRVTSDVSLTVRYGLFRPGAAYPGQGIRHFLYTGLTYSF